MTLFVHQSLNHSFTNVFFVCPISFKITVIKNIFIFTIYLIDVSFVFSLSLNQPQTIFQIFLRASKNVFFLSGQALTVIFFGFPKTDHATFWGCNKFKMANQSQLIRIDVKVYKTTHFFLLLRIRYLTE